MRLVPVAMAGVAAALAGLAGCSGSSGDAKSTVTVTSATVTVTAAAPWSAGTATSPAPPPPRPTSAAPPPTTRRPPAPTTRAAPPAPPARPPSTARAPIGVRVPNMIGDSLGAAYTRLSDLGVPRSRRSSHDISGESRTVLQPDNWRVCTQKPAAGTIATAQTIYQFGVVKFGERCP